MIKAIIFDMDGVLIDAKEWHYEALNQALAEFGYDIPREAHISHFDGLPTSKKLEMLSVEKGLPRELHAVINENKQVCTMDIVEEKCRPNPIHEHALSSLKAKGYRLAVASNSIRNTVEVMLRKAGLDQYLEFMLSTADVLYPKPNPEIYNKAISRLNLLPQECLIVEDNENGIKAARASGAHVLVVKDIEEVNFVNIMSFINDVDLTIGSEYEACQA